MVPQWCFVVEINGSLKEMREGAKTNSLEPSDQVVKVGDGRVGRFRVRAPCWLLGSQMSKCPTGYKQSL